jgi:hypothetical protein
MPSWHTVGQTRITWQGLIVLGGLLIVGAMGYMSVANPRDYNAWHGVLEVSVSIMLAACVVALWSRLSSVDTRARRAEILKRLFEGIALIAAAMAATVVLYKHPIGALGSKWFILPTGLYFAGMALVANAMNPDAG